MAQIVAAVIVLFGVMIATLGFYQSGWAQENTPPTTRLEAQTRAQEILWQKLERINFLLRGKDRSNPEAFAMIRDFNKHFLLNSLYLDDDTQNLCLDYLESLERLRTAVYSSGNDDVVNFFERTMVQIPPSVVEEVNKASAEVNRLRKVVKAHLAYTRR